MNIIVDAFGGDNAPAEVIKGCRMAVDRLGVDITLTGDEKKIKECAEKINTSMEGISIVHAAGVFDIHTEPSEILKSGKGTSMETGLRLLSEEKGDAFLSAGSTGALVRCLPLYFLRQRDPLCWWMPELTVTAARICWYSLP